MVKLCCRSALWVLSLGLLCLGASVQASELKDSWVGTYECNKQQRIVTLTFVDDETAQFDYAPGENAPVFPAGSYLMDVWNKGDEMLLTGREWIQRPPNKVMVSLRLTRQNDQLNGNVQYKGCGEIKLINADNDNSDVRAPGIVALPESTQYPMYFTGYYRCNSDTSGVYTKIAKTKNNGLLVELGVRGTATPRKAKMYKFTLFPGEDHYSGQEQKGKYGLTIDFGDNGESPVITWLDSKGHILSICQSATLESAVAPAEYWQEYFKLAGQKNPDLSTVKEAVHHYKTLPMSDYLANTEKQNSISKRNTQWKELQTAFKSSVPLQVQSLPVATPQERKEARRIVREMDDPGFRHKVDFAELYGNKLLSNGIAPESLYFSGDNVACERVRIGRIIILNNPAGVAKYAGLPAIELDEKTINAVIKKTDECAQQNPNLQQASAVITSLIGSRFPKLIKISDNKVWLQSQATDMLAKPRELETLVSTDGYKIQDGTLRQRRITENQYKHYFATSVADAKAEAIKNSAVQLQAYYTDEPENGVELETTFNQCRSSLGNVTSQSAEWLKSLSDICVTESQSRLKTYIAELSKSVGSEIETEDDIVEFLASGQPTKLFNFAASLGLQNEVSEYQAKTAKFKKMAGITLAVKLQENHGNGTDKNEVPGFCNDNNIYPYIKSACVQISNDIAREQRQKRCDAVVQTLDLPGTYAGGNLIYGDSLNSKDINIKTLSCQLNNNGIDLLISQNGIITAKESKYERELFTSSIALVKDDGDVSYWEMKDMEVKTDSPMFQNKSAGQIIECLLAGGSC